jgi:hypothetical protein
VYLYENIIMEKECNKHGLTEFVIRKDGRARCKKCAVEAVQKRRDNLKILAVEYKGGKCENTECGYSKCVGALEFHHIDGDKEFGIASKGYTRSWESVKSELNKCVMLCANCHREVHAKLLDISNLNSSYHREPTIVYEVNYCIDCGCEIGKGTIRCAKCHLLSRRKVVRPPLDILLVEIEKLGYSGVGRKYGVSDNSIRKWVKKYNK